MEGTLQRSWEGRSHRVLRRREDAARDYPGYVEHGTLPAREVPKVLGFFKKEPLSR